MTRQWWWIALAMAAHGTSVLVDGVAQHGTGIGVLNLVGAGALLVLADTGAPFVLHVRIRGLPRWPRPTNTGRPRRSDERAG